jgi:hypothetical protein
VFGSCSVFVWCVFGFRSVGLPIRSLEILTGYDMQNPERIFRELPERPARSRLEPYKKLIRGLLGRHRSYREIVRILAGECGVKVSVSTLHDFARLRLKTQRKPASIRASRSKSEFLTANATLRVAEKGGMQSSGEHRPLEAVFTRIAELKQRPASGATADVVFHYDPSKPLVLSTVKEPKETGH